MNPHQRFWRPVYYRYTTPLCAFIFYLKELFNARYILRLMGTYTLSKVKPEMYDSIAAFRKEILDNDGDFDGCQDLDKYDDLEKWDLNCRLFESEDTLPPGYS